MVLYVIFLCFLVIVFAVIFWILFRSNSEDYNSDNVKPWSGKWFKAKFDEVQIDMAEVFGISPEDIAAFGYEKSWPILIYCYENGIKKGVRLHHTLVQNNQDYIFDSFTLRYNEDSSVIYLIGFRSKNSREYTVASYIDGDMAVYYKLKQ